MKTKKLNKLFYPKFALNNIKKNGRFYYPYLITCIFTIAMFYIMCFIAYNPGINKINGGSNLKIIIELGIYVVGIFSFIFLIYTNSFLTKRRKKEFGMYNILGMEKRHLGKMMVYESLYCIFGTLFVGIISGIVLSELILMILCKILKFEGRIKFIVSGKGIIITVLLYTAIFIIILIGNLISIWRANPIELLHGTNAGEKEPKTKLLLALIGLASLSGGYYIAITTKSALDAIQMFFVAVVLVIVGTYCLFMSGSIVILKLLRKNKKYYYKTSHFTAISGMLYRMKKNAAGLASICILSTMVLVVVSTTVSMYVGTEDALKYRFPYDIRVNTDFLFSQQDNREETSNNILKIVKETINEKGMSDSDFNEFTNLSVITGKNKNKYEFGEYFYNVSKPHVFDIIAASDYEKITGNKVDLEKNQVLECSEGKELEDKFFLGNKEFSVVKKVDKFNLGGEYTSYIADVHLIVVSDIQTIQDICNDRYSVLGINKDNEGKSVNNIEHIININFKNNDENIVNFYDSLSNKLKETNTRCECRQKVRSDFYVLYGGLLFVGIFLGVLFLIITVLIIYYKQITEGYEDRERFVIMQKVGMSRLEVRQSIKSQVLTVFLLPIVVASMHIAGAFKMITKLLALLNLTNVNLFKICTIWTIGIFIVVYCLVYLITSKTYYNIVESK